MNMINTDSDARLQRFRVAQDGGNPSPYELAIAELQEGRKTTHWIWFVLPQLRGIVNHQPQSTLGSLIFAKPVLT